MPHCCAFNRAIPFDLVSSWMSFSREWTVAMHEVIYSLPRHISLFYTSGRSLSRKNLFISTRSGLHRIRANERWRQPRMVGQSMRHHTVTRDSSLDIKVLFGLRMSPALIAHRWRSMLLLRGWRALRIRHRLGTKTFLFVSFTRMLRTKSKREATNDDDQ